MEESDFLFTLAEVATAFAGFATLVVVIQERLRGSVERLERTRLTRMLQLAVLVVLFGLLPYVPFHFGLAPEFVWRLSTGLLALAWLAYWVMLVRRILSIPGALGRVGPINLAMLWGLHPAMLAIVWAGAAGAWGDRLASTYVASLLVLLAIAAVLFIQLVATLSEDPAVEEGESG